VKRASLWVRTFTDLPIVMVCAARIDSASDHRITWANIEHALVSAEGIVVSLWSESVGCHGGLGQMSGFPMAALEY
jgi:hypothetical protein